MAVSSAAHIILRNRKVFVMHTIVAFARGNHHTNVSEYPLG